MLQTDSRYQDIFLYIVDNKPNLKGTRVCGIIMQDRRCKSFESSTWDIEIPKRQLKSNRVSTELRKPTM